MKKYLAELIGTFCLVFIGCGTAVLSGNANLGLSSAGILGVSIAFGFAVVAMAYAIGPVSGCHINPAVTVGVLVAGRMSAKDAAGYFASQLIGAAIGAGVLYLIANGKPGFAMTEWGLGSNGYGDGYLGNYSITSAFIAESVGTCIFLFVILAVTSKYGNGTMAGLAIGITLMLIHLVIIPVTGTSVNPARSFGPAIFAGGKALAQLWLFFVAPTIGAILAALIWKFGFEADVKKG
jgi:aquaporin Z